MTKPPRIIALVQLPPPMHGAATMNERALVALRKICDVTVLEMRFAKNPRDIARMRLGKLVMALGLWLKLLLALRRKPDALYICFAPTGGAFYRDCLYVMTAKILGIATILHLHGRGLQAGRGHWLTAFLQRHAFAGQTAIILGKALRNEIDGLQCRSKIIANCLPDTAFKINHDPISTTTPRLLYLSNLFRSKGIDDVLAACAILKQRNIDFALDTAGAEGDLSTCELSQLIHNLNLSDHCHYHGPVDADIRTKLLSNANLFLFPSSYPNEAQPLVVLEAMAAGVPIVSSTIGTLVDIVHDGETGRICQPGNPEMLANIVSDALTQPTETHEMARAAKAFCNQHFRANRFEKELQQLIKEIIS